MNKFLIATVLGISSLSFNASAHGPAKAQHGGVVQSTNDLSFELVPRQNGASLYVVNHDAPADVSKMTGKLTVLNGTEKSETELKPADAGRLEATGVKLVAGSKIVATISSPGSKTMTVRFTIR